MNENKTSCAPADNQQTLWDRIDWIGCQKATSAYCKGSEGRQTGQGESLAVDADPLFLRKSLSRKESYF